MLVLKSRKRESTKAQKAPVGRRFSRFGPFAFSRFLVARHSIFAAAFALFVVPLTAAEPDPVKVALLVDGMATRGSSYDAAELHALGQDGLTAVLDYLLPDTAAKRQQSPGLSEDRLARLVHQLDADDFPTREHATEELIANARGNRPAIEQATRNDSLEVRLRAERILASWESHPASRLSAYLSGFWTYIEKIADPPRLKILAERTVIALQPGLPEGDRLHLVRLCIAGVAHGRDYASCDLLSPLIQHQDVRVATLVTETVGAYKTDPHFLPVLLVDALQNDRATVVEAALRFVLGSQDASRKADVQAALQRLLTTGPEPLKFQACLPLIRDFQDAEAWAYVIEQAGSDDTSRVRTALNWIGDTKPATQPPSKNLLTHFDRLLKKDPGHRRAAVLALSKFSGRESITRLISRLSDPDETVAREADAALSAQPDRDLVKHLLQEAPLGGSKSAPGGAAKDHSLMAPAPATP